MGVGGYSQHFRWQGLHREPSLHQRAVQYSQKMPSKEETLFLRADGFHCSILSSTYLLTVLVIKGTLTQEIFVSGIFFIELVPPRFPIHIMKPLSV